MHLVKRAENAPTENVDLCVDGTTFLGRIAWNGSISQLKGFSQNTHDDGDDCIYFACLQNPHVTREMCLSYWISSRACSHKAAM